MSLISKPVDWEVFSIPPIQSVQYYSILKKQREFSQLIKQYDAQVFRHSYLHYCGIVPKYLSSFSNRCEIFIVFLDETSSTSFIGFRVKVSKETFIYESKSLLLFLKNSEKAVFYSMNNNCIHVQCGTNAWELFYLLYDDYLRKYVLTIIGTRFFYNFVYSHCIEKEKQLLRWLYKSSKIIRIDKSSIYYKIHRKRKISVSDLIHMTLNMPKRKKYILPSFNCKESLVNSDVNYGDFYTVAGNKINFTKLTCKKFKSQEMFEKPHQEFTLEKRFHKRKWNEVEADQNLEPGTSYRNKSFKVLKPCSAENEWKQYQTLKPFNVPNYSSISFINTLVPSLLKSESVPCNVNSPSIEIHSVLNFPSSSFESKGNEISSSTVHMAYKFGDHKERIKCQNSENLIEKTSLHESKSLTTYSRCDIPNVFPSHYSTFSNNHKSLSCTNNSDVTKSCDINSIHFSRRIKDSDTFAVEEEDVTFSTAAGKAINISNAALLKAYKFCEKEQILPEKSTSDVVKQKPLERNAATITTHEVHEKTTSSDLVRKSLNKNISLSKNPPLLTLNNENMPKKLTTHLSNTESFQKDTFDISEDVTFSTAAGKTITVSNSAIEAAQKLIHKVNNEDKMPLRRERPPIQNKQFYSKEISNDGCTSKADDEDMDNTLVEKFFEDVQFDEKELELTKSDVKKDNLNIIMDSKDDKCLPARKPRKSLGGRRSMRYCSDKL